MPDETLPQRTAEMQLAQPGDVVFPRGSAAGLPRAAPAGWPPDIHPFDLIDAAWHMAVRDSVYSWPGDVNANGHQLINAKFDAATKAAAQTPWLQDIDAAGYSLRNAGFVLGANVAAQLVGYNIYYDGAWKKQQDGPGLALIKAQAVAGSALYASPTVTGAAVPVPTPALTFRDDGLIDVARDAAFYGRMYLPAGLSFSRNVTYDGANWRYSSNGSGFFIGGGGGNTLIQSCPAGTTGAIATMQDAIVFYDSGVIGIPRPIQKTQTIQVTGNYTPASGSGVEISFDSVGHVSAQDRTAGVVKDLRLYGNPLRLYSNYTEVARVTDNVLAFTNANGERIRIYDNGGINHAIGIENSCMWQQVATNAVFRWYCGVAPDNGASYEMSLYPAHLRLQQATEFDLDFILKSGPANMRTLRIQTIPGKIALEHVNDAYNAVISSLALYQNATISSVPVLGKLNTAADLDPAIGNGFFYAYLASNTQLVFRVRGNDGAMRQGTLNLA